MNASKSESESKPESLIDYRKRLQLGLPNKKAETRAWLRRPEVAALVGPLTKRAIDAWQKHEKEIDWLESSPNIARESFVNGYVLGAVEAARKVIIVAAAE